MNTSVSSKKPWLLVFLIDSSHSMGADWGASTESMSRHVMNAVNSTIYELAMEHCVINEEVKNRIDLSVLSYGGDASSWALLPNPNSNGYCKAGGPDGWITGYRGVSSETGQDVPYWIELEPDGYTPMRDAIKRAAGIVKKHCEQFPESFPPTVINISDGEPTDCGNPIDWEDLQRESKRISECKTNNGSALFCNVHLDPLGEEDPHLYPDRPGNTEHQRGLWEMSSEVPFDLCHSIFSGGPSHVDSRPRFYVYNADLPAFQKFLKFGTRRTELQDSPVGGSSNSVDSRYVEEANTTTEEENGRIVDAEFTIVEEE